MELNGIDTLHMAMHFRKRFLLLHIEEHDLRVNAASSDTSTDLLVNVTARDTWGR